MSPSVVNQRSARVHTLRFVAGVHVLRSLGLGLGALMIGVVLYRERAGLPLECVLALYGFAWPHLAHLLARRSAHPMRAERRSLMLDSMLGGFWIALMHFNLLPCVVLATMLAMNNIGAGGRRLLLRGLLVEAVACMATTLVVGFHPQPVTDPGELLASLPITMFYPLAVAAMANMLNRRVHQQNRLLARISSIDGLSELLNRSHWEEAVEDVLQNRRTDGCAASLLMIDIDHFKQINDYYGHVVGDDVIGRVGAIIRRSMREGDIAGRYGGDEFGVVLNGVNATVAAQIAERIRTSVHAASFEQAEDLRCTLSIGVAQADGRVDNAREWIRQADAALYEAKTRGRNRLVSLPRNWSLDAHAA